jgi:hypothetical protein
MSLADDLFWEDIDNHDPYTWGEEEDDDDGRYDYPEDYYRDDWDEFDDVDNWE